MRISSVVQIVVLCCKYVLRVDFVTLINQYLCLQYDNAQLNEKKTAVDAPPLKVSKRGYVVDYYFGDLIAGDCSPEKFDEIWDLIAILQEDGDDFVKKHVSFVL